MKKGFTLAWALLLTFSGLQADPYADLTQHFITGKADIKSMSVLSFGPEGILFVGDAIGGKVYALDVKDRVKNESEEGFQLKNIETKLASLLGTEPSGVLIHDFAVNPISKNIYLAVSRTDATQLNFWRLPNDLGNATILLKVASDGEISEVSFASISHSVSDVPKVVEPGKESWRKSDLRTEGITDLAYADGKLYVAGLSNEAFASNLRVLDFPFTDNKKASSLEVWHIAHGKSETEAPIRTFLPYTFDGVPHLLASYTCTPFVSFPVSAIENGKHIKVKTLAEFGFGNMPIDIITYTKAGKEYILMSNTSKSLIKIDPNDIPKAENITRKLEKGEYAIGLPHDAVSKVGISHLDNYNDKHVMVLQRMPNGFLNLQTVNVGWL
ncbi:MAG: hypothetical protein AAFQ87_17650 [Bacteroidota bacterium]